MDWAMNGEHLILGDIVLLVCSAASVLFIGLLRLLLLGTSLDCLPTFVP